MSKQVFTLNQNENKVIEKVLVDENIHYAHMILPQNEGLPIHNANATVYMTVIRGILSIGLDDGGVEEHEAGTLLKIPYQAKMNVRNLHTDMLELIVVKAPAPAQ